MLNKVPTRMFDKFANEHPATKVRLGNQQSSNQAILLLVSGIPTKARFSFEKVSQIDSLALIEIWFWDSINKKDAKAEFRNIPITK